MKFHVGDWVVYSKRKASTRPGPRAESIRAAPHGETYWYQVDKYWRVAAILDEHRIEVSTRTGKHHQIDLHDRNLRKATLRERLFLRDRFPRTQAPMEEAEYAG